MDLSENPIGTEGCASLSLALSNPHFALEELDLSRCSLGDAAVRALSSGLRVSRTLKRLNLRRNKITRSGGAALLSALASWKVGSLTELDLAWNRIAGWGDALISKLRLEDLDLSHNALHSGAAAPLPTPVVELVHPGLSALAEDEEGEAAPFHVIRAKVTVAPIETRLADAVAKNKSLFHLNLAYTNLSPLGVAAICKSLRDNARLLGPCDAMALLRLRPACGSAPTEAPPVAPLARAPGFSGHAR